MESATPRTVETINLSALIERGWTQAAVSRFLGNPDKTKINPHYRCAAPMRLYQVVRVELAESSDEFRQWQEKSAKRREGAIRAASVRREKKEAEEKLKRAHPDRVREAISLWKEGRYAEISDLAFDLMKQIGKAAEAGWTNREIQDRFALEFGWTPHRNSIAAIRVIFETAADDSK